MKRSEIEHVLRASAAIAQESSFVLVGSQAALLTIENPDPRLLVSMEIDLYPAIAPEKADLIDGAIGALSTFHDTYGYHADGVGPDTAVMPADWMTRASFHDFGDITAICPDIHDLAVAKCAAGCEKDAAFVRVLFDSGAIEPGILISRIRSLDRAAQTVDRIAAWAERRRAESAQAGEPS